MQKIYDQMQKPVYYFLLSILFMFSSAALADNKDKIVLHLNDPHKMSMLTNNVINLRKIFGEKASIVVVANGPAVARFTKIAPSREQLDKMLEMGAEINVCSFALKNRSIVQEQLLDGVSYLENGGLAHLVNLQKQGYTYIKP